MPTTASMSAKGGSTAAGAGAAMGCPRGKKFLRAKRKLSGNKFPQNPSDESGRKKFFIFQNGILPSPCKDKSSLVETTQGHPKHLGYRGSDELGFENRRFGVSKKLFSGKGSGRRNCRTDGNHGTNLVMEKVTILKRGENIESVVGGRSSDEEEIGRGQTRSGVENVHGGFWRQAPTVSMNPRPSTSSGVPGRCVDDNGRDGLSVSVEKKTLKQYSHAVWGSADKGQVRKAKAVASRVSQVCPVGSPDSKRDGGGGCVAEKPVTMVRDVSLTRMGPEPSEMSKDVFARSISIESGSSDTSSDVGDSLLKLGGSESSGSSVKSVGSSPPSPRPFLSDNMGGFTPELTVSSEAAWAGPAYAKSPPPSWLPLPKFFMRRKVVPNNVVENNDLRGGGNENSAASGSAIQESKMELVLPVGRSNVNGQGGVDQSETEFALLFGRCNLNVNSQGGVDAFATRNLRRLLHLE